MEPYVKLAVANKYHLVLLEPDTAWRDNPQTLAKRNGHGVPLISIEAMQARYEVSLSGIV
jgi:hypothetical protein